LRKLARGQRGECGSLPGTLRKIEAEKKLKSGRTGPRGRFRRIGGLCPQEKIGGKGLPIEQRIFTISSRKRWKFSVGVITGGPAKLSIRNKIPQGERIPLGSLYHLFKREVLSRDIEKGSSDKSVPGGKRRRTLSQEERPVLELPFQKRKKRKSQLERNPQDLA